MDNSLYTQVNEMAASNKLIASNIKKQSLNVMKERLDAVVKATKQDSVAQAAKYDLLIIEDCYHIDMYKFQFKGLLDILQKDLDTLERAVGLEVQNI